MFEGQAVDDARNNYTDVRELDQPCKVRSPLDTTCGRDSRMLIRILRHTFLVGFHLSTQTSEDQVKAHVLMVQPRGKPPS